MDPIYVRLLRMYGRRREDNLEGKLVELGLRKEGDFILSSRVRSEVFWDIEELFNYPKWIQEEAVREFIWKVGMLKPDAIVGIPRGGYILGGLMARCLGVDIVEPATARSNRWGIVVVDDVLTTGNTISSYLQSGLSTVLAVAVLINRSDFSEMNGVPIISGVVTDFVEI